MEMFKSQVRFTNLQILAFPPSFNRLEHLWLSDTRTCEMQPIIYGTIGMNLVFVLYTETQTLLHMRAENRSMRPQTVIRQTRRTLGRPCCQGRPHLPHLVSPVPCSCVRSPQLSDNLFSCPGPRPRHQMLRRLDITFIRWAFPKIRGFKHNCNYPPSSDDGMDNGPARNNGIKKIDKWDL